MGLTINDKKKKKNMYVSSKNVSRTPDTQHINIGTYDMKAISNFI